MTAVTSDLVYDSARPRRAVLSEIENFRRYRGLIRLLIAKELTVRYKRSTLGVWWTILNPLLTAAVMWVVFSAIFRFATDPVPFIVYLLSGIILVTFFTQAVIATSSSIVNSANVLAKVYVPPEVFSFAAAAAAAVNFFISLVPLLLIQLVLGVGIPWTVLLVPIPAFAMLCLVTGLGLLVASAAVYFYDVLDLTQVFLQLIGYLTPSFYPLDIITDGRLLAVVQANPLYSYLTVFRGLVYEGAFAPWWNFAVMFGTAFSVLVLGVWVFSRSWKNLAMVL